MRELSSRRSSAESGPDRAEAVLLVVLIVLAVVSGLAVFTTELNALFTDASEAI